MGTQMAIRNSKTGKTYEREKERERVCVCVVLGVCVLVCTVEVALLPHTLEQLRGQPARDLASVVTAAVGPQAV